MASKKFKNKFAITYEGQIKDSIKANKTLNKKGKCQYSDFSYRQPDNSTYFIAYGKNKTKHRLNRYAVRFHTSHIERANRKHGQNS